MSSRLLVNLVEPSDIVVPDTGGTTPDTGLFSVAERIGDTLSNNVFLIAIIGLAVLLAVVAIVLIRRHKKQNLMRAFGGSYTPMTLNANRYIIPKLAGLSFIILVSVFGILKFNDNQRMANAETMEGPALTITTEDITAIDIEMDDEAAFGIGESKVKVTTATETGYTLMAYVDSKTTSLANESGDAISMLETSQSQALTDNTWGISLSKPNSQEETLFRGLPTAEKDAMVVKVSGSSATEANDETTLYYAAYVTPELDYGTYEGVTINYVAVAHVLDEDVTVNYHGNGYYFDEAGTKDVNTVTYGTSCGLAYVGGNCTKVYTTEEPYAVVKTPNIRDDGTQDGAYPKSQREEYNGIIRVYPVVSQVVNIPGADAVRVELNYSLTRDAYIAVIRGVIDENAMRPDEYEFIEAYPDNISGAEVYEFGGDTITILVSAYNDPVSGYDYGAYAKVYPIYDSAPDGVETIESTVCHFAKSDNLDDEGNKIESYQFEQYDEYYDEWNSYRHIQTITIPGADRVKVEIEYAITDEAWLGVVEGHYIGKGSVPAFYVTTWDDQALTSSNKSGKETFVVDSATVTFVLNPYDSPVSGYDYGFYARLYPVYDEEHEDTAPEQVCLFTNKSGEYSLPVGVDYIPADMWYSIAEHDGYLVDNIWFSDGAAVESFILYYYDSLAGRTLDVYFANRYEIYYDANGGSGSMDSVWALPHTNETISYNHYVNTYYSFIGWNTRADGSGTWYQPDDVVLDLAQPGETITLYAQWKLELVCNPEATVIDEAGCLQDFAGLNSEQIVGSMIPEVEYALADKRDEKIYTIVKILVGDEYEVWMTQNLDLNIDSNKTYTNEDTDIGYNINTQQYGTATWRPVRSTYSTGDTTWNRYNSSPESYDPGDLCWNGVIAPDYNGTLNTYAGACGNDRHYHIGNYYNWTAAWAMNDSSNYTRHLEDIGQSICPVGWRLPVYSNDRSYDNLRASLNLTSGISGNVQNAPVYFTYGGGWAGSSRRLGGNGYYLASAVSSDSGAWGFDFSRDGDLFSHVEVNRHSSGLVRCVARTSEVKSDMSISDLTYMQDFATLSFAERDAVLYSMNVNQQYELKDNRDNKTYTIAKLADGNVWMTQNLDHDIVIEANYYTPANTDISSAWTPSRATYATGSSIWNTYYYSPESYDPGDLCWNGTLAPDYSGLLNDYTEVCGNNKHFHLGNYYNWSAAAAMNDSTSYVGSQDVGQSICPAGWRLPTKSGNKSYDNLQTKLDLTSGVSGNVQSGPTYFVYGGSWQGRSSQFGGYGSFWSASDSGEYSAMGYNFGRDGQMSGNSLYRSGGLSVRCVAR